MISELNKLKIKKTMEPLYNMKLHEKITVGNTIEVMRVPGGWLYNSTFVEYNTEFKNIRKTIKHETLKEYLENKYALRAGIAYKSKKTGYVLARHFYCKIMNEKSYLNKRQIAENLKYKKDSNVHNAVTTINNRINTDPYIKAHYKEILKDLELE